MKIDKIYYKNFYICEINAIFSINAKNSKNEYELFDIKFRNFGCPYRYSRLAGIKETKNKIRKIIEIMKNVHRKRSILEKDRIMILDKIIECPKKQSPGIRLIRIHPKFDLINSKLKPIWWSNFLLIL